MTHQRFANPAESLCWKRIWNTWVTASSSVREYERDESGGDDRKPRGHGPSPPGVERYERRRCDDERLRFDQGRESDESSRGGRAALAGSHQTQNRERRVGGVEKSEDRARKPRDGERPVEGPEGEARLGRERNI